MIPAITAFWTGLPKPVREAIMWIGVILAVIILGKAYVRAKQEEAVRRAREKDKARTIEVVREIEKESGDDADEAIEAGASAPRASTHDELSKLPDRIFRD